MKSLSCSENSLPRVALTAMLAATAAATALALALVTPQTALADQTSPASASNGTPTAISFSPAVGTYKLVEAADGSWVSEENSDGEFCYYSAPSFALGDTLTVTYEGGTQVAYVYGYPKFGPDDDYDSSDRTFVGEDNSTISDDEVRFDSPSEQYTEHWYAGNEYSFTLTYEGLSCSVPVKIVDNPVKSIELRAAERFQLIEGIDEGRWDSYYDYELNESVTYYYYGMVPDFHEGDVLRATGTDGSVTDYHYHLNRDDYSVSPSFVTEDGSGEIHMYELDRRLLQYGPWETGTTQQMRITYAGRRCLVDIDIIENPVASISYTPAKPFELAENVDGWWPSSHDDDDDWDEEESGSVDTSYFHYRCPNFQEGDVLTVTYTNGNAIDYTFKKVLDASGNETGRFISASGEAIETEAIYCNDNYTKVVWANLSQTEEWTVGSTYSFEIRYMTKSCDVPVTIVAEPSEPQPSEQQISASDVSVAYGKTAQLNAKLTSGDGTLTYESSDTSVATVDGNGKITPKKVGTATITITASATLNFAPATTTVKVTVTKGTNTFAAKLVKAKQTVKYGKKTTLAASKVFKVTKNVSKGKVTYKKTSGSAKIKVSSAGKVTVKKGLKKGTYTVKVKLTAAATTNYKAASKTLTLTLKIKVK